MTQGWQYCFATGIKTFNRTGGPVATGYCAVVDTAAGRQVSMEDAGLLQMLDRLGADDWLFSEPQASGSGGEWEEVVRQAAGDGWRGASDSTWTAYGRRPI